MRPLLKIFDPFPIQPEKGVLNNTTESDEVLSSSNPISVATPSPAQINMRSGHSPKRLLASQSQWMIICITIAILSPLIALSSVLYLVNIQSRKQWAFSVDGSGTFHTGPLDELGFRSNVIEMAALLAAQAAFQRSTIATGMDAAKLADFDLPELVEGLFRADAREKLKADLSSQAQDIASRHISQKIEVAEVKGYKERRGTRFVSIKGNLIRTGNVEGVPVSESVPVRAIFTLRQNPRLDQKGQFPFIVTDLKITYLDDKAKGMQSLDEVSSKSAPIKSEDDMAADTSSSSSD